MQRLIVDAHVHVWELPSARHPWQPIGTSRPSMAWTIGEQVLAMERAAIAAGVLIQTSWYGFDNSYIVASAQRYPGRFGLTGLVDPADGAVEEQVARLAEAGVRGLRLAPLTRPDISWFGTPQTDRLWRAAGDHGLVLTLLASLEQVAAAEPTIACFSHVPVVVDHLGRPDLETDPARPLYRQVLRLARYNNLYLKASALATISHEPFPHRDALNLVRRALASYGPGRVLWGSDYAVSRDRCSLHTALELIDRALGGYPAVDRERVLAGTACRLWRLEPKQAIRTGSGSLDHAQG